MQVDFSRTWPPEHFSLFDIYSHIFHRVSKAPIHSCIFLSKLGTVGHILQVGKLGNQALPQVNQLVNDRARNCRSSESQPSATSIGHCLVYILQRRELKQRETKDFCLGHEDRQPQQVAPTSRLTQAGACPTEYYFFMDRKIPDRTYFTIAQWRRQRAEQVLWFLQLGGEEFLFTQGFILPRAMAGRLAQGTNLWIITSVILSVLQPLNGGSYSYRSCV